MKSAELKNENRFVRGRDEEKAEVINFLNFLLANEFGLFTKNLNYHWNVTGSRFYSLHLFLEETYKQLLQTMDETAERVRVLSGTPLCTVSEMKGTMDIEEKKGSEQSSNQMIENLLTDNRKIIGTIVDFLSDDKKFKYDPGTQDLLVRILQMHEITSWKLKSYLA